MIARIVADHGDATIKVVMGDASLKSEEGMGRLSCEPSSGEDLVLISPENYVRIVQGSSVTLTLTVLKNDGSPRDLTGARVIMTIKAQIADHSPVLQKNSTDSSQILVSGQEARLGRAAIFFRPPDTRTLETGSYVFDVWVIFPDGSRQVVIQPSVFEVVIGVTWIP